MIFKYKYLKIYFSLQLTAERELLIIYIQFLFSLNNKTFWYIDQKGLLRDNFALLQTTGDILK